MPGIKAVGTKTDDFGARQLSLRLLVLRLRLCQLTVRLSKLSPSLVRCCLKRARVDLEEQLTVFVNVKNDMAIAQEEIFGPVLSLSLMTPRTRRSGSPTIL